MSYNYVMSIYLIYNSHSGSYSPTLKNVIQKKLQLINKDIVEQDAYTNDINIGKDCELVCVAGGDGTINNVVRKIFTAELQDKIKLIIIPLGSANVLANTLNIKKSIVLKNWNNLKPTAIEVGKTDDHLLLTAASLGTISTIINNTKHFHKSLFGFAGYILNLLTHWHLKRSNFNITIDGKKSSIVAHSLVYSIGLSIVGFKPRLKKADGLIDVYLLKNKTPLGYLGVFWQFIFNSNGRYLEKLSGQNISCITEQTLELQIDGEKQTSTNVLDAKIIGRLSILK